jgi:hypothetical protein
MIKFVPIVLVLIVILTQGLDAHGQWPAFGVYHITGNIKCAPAKGGGTKPVVSHSWLYDGDKLMLLDNISDVILFDRDNNYIHLSGKGTYATADIQKMQRIHVQDNLTVRYLSLVWDEVLHPSSGSQMDKEKFVHSTGGVSRGLTVMLTPRDGYATSMDSVIFRWHKVSWARKYFLRLRTPDGDLRVDSVLIDTAAVVHFSPRMNAGNTFFWSLDLVGESGRLQFSDSSHIVLVDESIVIPQVPAPKTDSLGGVAAILQRIEQFEEFGCIRHADGLFQRLIADFPADAALDRLYAAFRERNYY